MLEVTLRVLAVALALVAFIHYLPLFFPPFYYRLGPVPPGFFTGNLAEFLAFLLLAAIGWALAAKK